MILLVLIKKGNTMSNKIGIYSHKFKESCTINGKSHDTLDFNFNKLTGRDMINIENEMIALQEFALAPEISRAFQAKMAAKAAGIGSDILESMPLTDFNKITNVARDFLLV